MKIPDVENELSLRSKEMNIPSQYDNVDWGKRKKLRNRKVSYIERGGRHTVYGSKAIMTKESTLTFKEHLLQESDDYNALPEAVLGEIKSNIRKGANDLEQKWKNALELTNKAYQVANVRRPTPADKSQWKQYEAMIAHSVKCLAAARGLQGEWRSSEILVREWIEGEGISKRRFFVEIPGEAAQEVAGEDMDSIIEAITNKIRTSRDVTGTKVRVQERTKTYAVLAVWVNGAKREEIVIKQVS